MATLIAGCGRNPDLHATRVVTVSPVPRHEAHALDAAVTRGAVTRYLQRVRWDQVTRWSTAAIYAAAVERARYAREAPPRRARGAGEAGTAPTAGAVEPGTGRCGGDLPPCWVLQRESRGDPRAENPTSTASGLWQFLDSTWAGFGGYSHASHAPVSVQNEKARLLWDGGRGCAHWSAC